MSQKKVLRLLASALLSSITMISLRTGFLLVVLAIGIGSCALRPQPEPPTLQQVDVSKITVFPGDTALVPTPGLRGGPGSVSPAGAIVRVFNLETQAPYVDALVLDDGSFDLGLDMKDGDELRLQVIATTGRSCPVDLTVDSLQSAPKPSIRALDTCLLVNPSLELDMGDLLSSTTGALRIENHCEFAVSFASVRMRRSVSGLEFPSNLPNPIAPSSSFELPIVYKSDVDLEEILFVEATAPQKDRRPITLRARVEKP